MRYVTLNNLLTVTLEITLIAVPILIIYHDYTLYNLSLKFLKHKTQKKLARHDFINTSTLSPEIQKSVSNTSQSPKSTPQSPKVIDIFKILPIHKTLFIDKEITRRRVPGSTYEERQADKLVMEMEHMAIKMAQWDKKMDELGLDHN